MPQTPNLPRNWLGVAASKGTSKWLQQFIRIYLERLQRGDISAEEFADELDDEFASRMLDTPKKQKNYRSNVVQALKVISDRHPAIPLVSLSTEQYRRLNDEQRQRLSDRETRYITSETAEVVVKKAESLLASAEWSDVGAGLAVLIGRRISEILLSTFSLKSPWSLYFSQMAKKSDEQNIVIEIPTLAPARTTLAAIDRLQAALEIADLKLNSLTTRQAKQTVNQRYSGAIASKCDEHFSHLVPARSDKDNLYTHIFRAVYATIAAHWYCPPRVPEHQFKAEIQGHFTLTADGRKLPNYSARTAYDDYAIGDGQGNRDGRLGIKLGRLSDLQILETFRKPSPDDPARSNRAIAPLTGAIAADTPAEPPAQDAEFEDVQPEDATTEDAIPEDAPEMTQAHEKSTKRPILYAEDVDRLAAMMAHEDVTGTTADIFHSLLNAHEAKQSSQETRSITTVTEVAQTFKWFTTEIEALRSRIAELEHGGQGASAPAADTAEPLRNRIAMLEQECDRLRAQQSDTAELTSLQSQNAQLNEELQAARNELVQVKAQNAQLNEDLRQTQERLDGIKSLLGGGLGRENGTAAGSSDQSTSPQVNGPSSSDAIAASDTSQDTTLQSKDDSATKIDSIVDDIIAWNTAQDAPNRRLRISVPIIKSLGLLVGASYQPAIQEVLKAREADIDEMHDRFTLSSRHNVKVDKDEVLQAIARDYMGLPNWQEASYG